MLVFALLLISLVVKYSRPSLSKSPYTSPSYVLTSEWKLQHAYTSTTISHPPSFKGTEVVLNVWQPFVEPRDFSLAQLWVMNTGLSYAPGSDDWALNTIEAGWQVYSELYGDKRPRLFVYWTVSVTSNCTCNNMFTGYGHR